MTKITLVEQVILYPLRQKQIMQSIQQPELASMANLKAEIEETMHNSKLEVENLEILHPAQDRYDKIQETFARSP